MCGQRISLMFLNIVFFTTKTSFLLILLRMLSIIKLKSVNSGGLYILWLANKTK